MNDFDKIKYGFYFSAIGIGLGWLLTQIGIWLQATRESKKTIRVVLFNLLEAYYTFCRSDAEEISKVVCEKLREHLPEDMPEDENIMFEMLMKQLAEDLIKTKMTESLEHIQTSFQESVKLLASVDPISAYYLSGKIDNMNFDKLIQNLGDSLQTVVPIEPEEQQTGLNVIASAIRPSFFADRAKDLEKEILSVARKAGWIIWFRARRLLKTLKKDRGLASDQETNELVDSIMENIKAQMNGGASPTANNAGPYL